MFSRIYDLTYQSILTPHNLLDNLELDNYTNLNYSKENGMIVCEIKCLIDNEEWVFYYLFNKESHLQFAYYIENNEQVFIFNRESELKDLRESFNEKISHRKKA